MTMVSRTGTHPAVRAHEEKRASLLGTLVVLFKLRIVLLLVFAAVGGALLGAHGRPTWGQMALLLLTGTMSAAGASALNQYLERDRDALMKRTARRPLVTGEVSPRAALVAASALVIGASALALLAGNLPLAFFLALGAFIYVGVYTLWLKPRSVLNVVIGGAAGSAAVLSGGAAVGQWTDPGVLILAALLFTWSPIHFLGAGAGLSQGLQPGRRADAAGGVQLAPGAVLDVGARAGDRLLRAAAGAARSAGVALPAAGWSGDRLADPRVRPVVVERLRAACDVGLQGIEPVPEHRAAGGGGGVDDLISGGTRNRTRRGPILTAGIGPRVWGVRVWRVQRPKPIALQRRRRGEGLG